MQAVVFEINSRYFAIDAQFMKTITQVPKINKVPLSQKSILGLINFQGEIISIVHPGILLDNSMAEFNDENVILILNFNNNEQDFAVGLFCDKIFDIIEITEKDKTVPPLEDLKFKELVSNTIIYQDKNIWLLDINKMLSPQNIIGEN